ncbi:MAG: AmmeMemoRadiSam system protein B [Candidatus Berkelbacteria bacterium]
MIVFAGIMPHPPIVIPEIGHDDAKKTQKTHDALLKLATDLAESEPDTIIIISPHMTHYPHLFNVCGMRDLYGNFNAFDWHDSGWHGHNNTKLAAEIVDRTEEEGLPAMLYDNGEDEYELDHGVMVPLHFLLEKLDFPCKVMPISYSIASRSEHFIFGQIIADICTKNPNERVAIIASGDLSHRLGQTPPAGMTYTGEEFDKNLVELIKKADEYSIINMDDEFVENAGECGYRSILIMLGAISGRDYQPEVLSYEGPFGVGYMVANMNVSSE